MLTTKLNQIVFLLAGLLLNFGLSAQSVHFNYTDGTNASYNLEDVRKIDFAANVMNLHLWDGSVYSWNMSTIGYYEYDEKIIWRNANCNIRQDVSHTIFEVKTIV